MTLIQVINQFLTEYETTLVQVRQGGRRMYLPLASVEDERVPLKVLRDRLREFELSLKKDSTDGE